MTALPFSRRVCVLSVLALALLQLGCSNHMIGRPKRIELVENRQPSDFEKEILKLEKDYDEAAAADLRQRIRDRYARKMVGVIDKRYNDFLDGMVGGRKRFDAGTDIVAVGLDTAAVLITPPSTKSILAGLSGLTIAGKSAINKTYFYEQTLPVLISQMESNRQAALAAILQGLQADVTTYPLHALQFDLNDYYSAGTIDGAIERIQEQAAEQAAEADEVRRRILQDVRADLATADTRYEQTLTFIVDPETFDNVRQQLLEWWASQDDAFQRAYVEDLADAHEVAEAALRPAGGRADPALFEPFLSGLTYSETNELLLAEAARNAADFALEAQQP